MLVKLTHDGEQPAKPIGQGSQNNGLLLSTISLLISVAQTLAA